MHETVQIHEIIRMLDHARANPDRVTENKLANVATGLIEFCDLLVSCEREERLSDAELRRAEESLKHLWAIQEFFRGP